MNSMIDDKAHHKVIGDVLHEWQALAAPLHIKTESGQKGSTPCLSLHHYKIPIENNFHSILGQAPRHNLAC